MQESQMEHPRRLVVILVAAILTLGAAGCFNPFNPLVSDQRAVSIPAPSPNSPANAIKLFSWCWSNRDPSLYAEIFTKDYRFIFAAEDSAGNAYRDTPWLRDDEISMATHMFSGGLDIPPASSITILLSDPLVVGVDPRKDPKDLLAARLYRSIRTNVNLSITFETNGVSNVNSIVGKALFYLVRGDAPDIIPEELALKGFKSDSTRWWIERWEDETAGSAASPSFVLPAGGTAARRPALPAGPVLQPGRVTFGQAKVSYL
jgi:hypothetical protein